MNVQNNENSKKTSKGFNAGTLIFGAIIAYLIITLCIYFTSDHLKSYEVRAGSLSYNTTYTGIAIRHENIVTAEASGFVSYFQNEARKVKVGSPIYFLSDSENTQVYDSETMDDHVFSTDNIIGLVNNISAFQTGFSPDHFDLVYDEKYSLESDVNDLKNQAAGIDNNEAFIDSAVKASTDGVISYMTDGLESITADDITTDLINSNGYVRTDLRDNSYINAGDPVYKLVTSEDWSICIPLDEDAWSNISENEIKSIEVRMEKDRNLLWADISLFDKDGSHYALLSFDNSMVRYISDRFLDVTLIIEEVEGLKIPLTSIVSKDFYSIPVDYLSYNPAAYAYGVYVREGDDADSSAVFTETDIIYENEDEGMFYIDTSVLDPGSRLIKPESSEFYEIGDTMTLTGVYNINKQAPVFRIADILYSNNEYCIVREGNDYGISNYDLIALDADAVK